MIMSVVASAGVVDGIVDWFGQVTNINIIFSGLIGGIVGFMGQQFVASRNLRDSLDSKSGWRKELYNVASKYEISLDDVCRVRGALRYVPKNRIDLLSKNADMGRKDFDQMTSTMIIFCDNILKDYSSNEEETKNRELKSAKPKVISEIDAEILRAFTRYLLKHHWEYLNIRWFNFIKRFRRKKDENKYIQDTLSLIEEQDALSKSVEKKEDAEKDNETNKNDENNKEGNENKEPKKSGIKLGFSIISGIIFLIILNGLIWGVSIAIFENKLHPLIWITFIMMLTFSIDFFFFKEFKKEIEYSNYHIDLATAVVTCLLVVSTLFFIQNQFSKQDTARAHYEGEKGQVIIKYTRGDYFKRLDDDYLKEVTGKPSYEHKELYIVENAKRMDNGEFSDYYLVTNKSEFNTRKNLISFIGIAIFTPIRLLIPIVTKKK